ncbi:MAG: histidine--tRNA ligase [Candidatus Berkelbacteria bacterium]|nr:MAG: histidine--tRNA ligase [Candidatus Berkelbacteria bacterium]QQG51600.1 MAG: histidine--tRNA ligase [Candidatus Berkelbacteria bacterium]
MDSQQLQPLSGFRDLVGSPKYEIASRLREIFESFGFISMDTPALERQDILLNKYGEEGQKQLYLFEDNGKRSVGLRFDLTVPLARYVAANRQSLNLPFKRYEIGSSWRAEKAQAGRLRQFTQADVDIVGVASLGAERELLEIIAAAEAVIAEFTVELNDRRLVARIFDELKVEMAIRGKVLRTLDKKAKISEEALSKELLVTGLTANQLRQMQGIFLSDKPTLDATAKLVGEEVVSDLASLLSYAKTLGLDVNYAPSMVRGLDYYTGTIIEASVKDAEVEVGSVIGGGRYDSLVEDLTGEKIPAVGISFGVDRLVDVTTEFIREGEIFIVLLPETENETRAWARKLRGLGKIVEVFPDSAIPLGKQIKYADKKGYAEIYLPTGEEWRQGQIVVKDLSSGAQRSYRRTEYEV